MGAVTVTLLGGQGAGEGGWSWSSPFGFWRFWAGGTGQWPFTAKNLRYCTIGGRISDFGGQFC